MKEGSFAMNASEVHGRLSKEIHDEVAAARQRGALTWEELDRILAAFDVSDYDAQLEALVIELETLPLRRPAEAMHEDHPHGLPGAGRISKRYLQELDRFPEMTRELEVAAARRLELAAQRLAAAEFRSPAAFSARRDEFQQIHDDFVERNLHQVVSEVYAYRTYHVQLDDLIQEGNAALMHAVDKFDWRHGVRFRTYLAWWIKQAVERYLAAQKGAVRVPHHLQQKLRRLKRTGKLPGGFDRDVTLEQVASAFEFDRDHAGRLVEASRTSYSLDQPLEEDGDTFKELLSETWEPTDGDRPGILQNRIQHLLADLDDRERKVLKLRFGLDGRKSRTLEEVGKELHLSRERSRQIQQRALVKLRQRIARTRMQDEI
jgi:RNA polymerase primary sigma factor